MDLFKQINTHKYLDLVQVEQDAASNLIVRIDEARPLEEGESEGVLKRYRVTFNDYVAYSIRDESFTQWDEYEKFDGVLFRKYSNSRFLDYLYFSTNIWIVEQIRESTPDHFGAVCLNHLLDVALCGSPIIEEID